MFAELRPPFTFLPSPALNFIDPGSPGHRMLSAADVYCSLVRNFSGCSHSLFSISGGSSPESMFSGREELVLLEQLVTPSSGLRFYLSWYHLITGKSSPNSINDPT